jgi:acyl phosphate:glycerol-3-phosphate acyltransferase
VVFFFIIVSYISGSVSVAGLIGKFKGINLATEGTRNPGATNVYRLIGPVWGILTGTLDFAKGIIPPLIAREIFHFDYPVIIMVAFAVIAGHNWSLFFHFQGGRGLATTLGTIAVLAFYPGLIAFLVGLGLSWWLKTRYGKVVRLSFLVYPLLAILLVVFSANRFLLYYCSGIMLLAYYRAWQVRNR